MMQAVFVLNSSFLDSTYSTQSTSGRNPIHVTQKNNVHRNTSHRIKGME